jgi:hypothetical protein
MWEADIQRIAVPGQLGEKFTRTPSQGKKARCGGTHLSSPVMTRSLNKEDQRPGGPEQKVEECLSNKHETLNSNPSASTAKKKRKNSNVA